MRVRFLRDFHWWPKANVVIGYREGTEKTVTRRCGERAVDAGAAERVTTKRQEKDDDQGDDA